MFTRGCIGNYETCECFADHGIPDSGPFAYHTECRILVQMLIRECQILLKLK